MRTIKLIELLYVSIYVVLSSQLLYYLLVMSDALRLVSIDNFLELRKAIDPIFKQRLTYVYYAGLLLSIALMILKREEALSFSYLLLLISFLCLVSDLVLAVKGNIPINNQIANYTSGSTECDWNSLRENWLCFITYRGIANVIGILSLLISFIFRFAPR